MVCSHSQLLVGNKHAGSACGPVNCQALKTGYTTAWCVHSAVLMQCFSFACAGFFIQLAKLHSFTRQAA